MKRIFIFLFGLLLSLSVIGSATANTIIYSNDFEDPPDLSGWIDAKLTTNSANGFPSTQYLGDYTLQESTTLTITNIAPHTQLYLNFDLYLFNTWDGDSSSFGPDSFSLSGDITGSWTFTNHQSAGQSYNGIPDEAYGPAGASQTQVYRNLGPTGSDDGFAISHTADTFSITFGGPTDQPDEQWGIDNVVVSIDSSSVPPPAPVPEPATFIFFGIGLLGLARVSRKKK